VEIARISDVVSDDKIGTMRLKFWDETIDKLYDKNLKYVPDQPVIKELKCVSIAEYMSSDLPNFKINYFSGYRQAQSEQNVP
jgi:hypothetical protein